MERALPRQIAAPSSSTPARFRPASAGLSGAEHLSLASNFSSDERNEQSMTASSSRTMSVSVPLARACSNTRRIVSRYLGDVNSFVSALKWRHMQRKMKLYAKVAAMAVTTTTATKATSRQLGCVPVTAGNNAIQLYGQTNRVCSLTRTGKPKQRERV
jgi:hypothetical protein